MMRDSDRRNIVTSLLKMNTPTWLTLAFAAFTLVTPAQSSEPRVVCYYTNWSVYRPGTARFNPQNINPYLCTHLIYAFGGFTKENALKPFDKYQDIEKGGYAKFTGLKTYNKNLKTMLAIGGWNEGSTRFSPMVASKERRKEFVRNAIKFLRQNRFDGLDLDWEYPAFRDGGKPKDRENYAKLVRELREEFDREAEKTGRPRLLLTMAVPAGIEYIQKGFDVKTLNQYLDWMNLLTYDYHSAFEPAVNHHAPLYPLEEPSEYSVDSELNIDYTIKYYLENGADRDKLVLGIPTYGRSYTLFNPDAVEIGSPADGPGEQGEATREKGYLAYYEICEALKPKQKKRSSSDEESDEEEDEDKPWSVIQPNSNAMGPVAYRGNQWVGYDDVDIVKKKAEYVAENGLGGIMFWSIDNDDFRGNCHGRPYPLIEAAKEAYIVALGSTDNAIVTDKPRSITTSRASSRRKTRPRSSTTTTTTTEKPSTNKRKSAVTSTTPSWNNTPEPPTTPDPGSDFKCTDEGFFPHPRDCKKYFWCLDSGPSNLGIVAHQFTCPSGLFFNKAADSCDFARNVLCKKPAAPAKAPATEAPTTKPTTTSTSTTTRRPVKLSTKSSALFRTTSTTTTPEPESEEEYEDEIIEDEAQDPKVIKELIDLIKKVGGVEQLEKHLHLAESSMSTNGAITTTPSSFNKKLYQKVLEKARANRLNTLLKTQDESAAATQNSRRGPQNAGLESTSDKDKLLRKDRPQYTTIQRNRPATTADPIDEEDPQVPDVPQQLARSRLLESEVKVATTVKPLQYVNIRRVRPTSDTADDSASRNALFERPESFVAVSEPSLDISVARRENMPEYVTIRRQRPTTEEATTVKYENEDKEEESLETALEREISSPPSQPQYTSIVRSRSTTLSPSEEKNNPEPPEPTTVLAVQIASLLNSPSASDEPEAPETTIAEATTADMSTTTTTTSRPTTTTTTTTPAPSTRRVVQRRRGSTTSTSTPPASSTTQVSSRNYSFVRRRRPLVKPNEISLSSEEDESSRKIRSTTPDNREVDGVKLRDDGQPIRPRDDNQAIRSKDDFQSRRTRVRFQQTKAEDSVPAAASPVSRGQYKAKFTRDEVLSLTPIDVVDVPEVPQFVQKQSFSARNERRFRGRTSTTIADSLADSDSSAATIEIRRPNILPRGRGRFTSSSTTQALDQSVATEVIPSQKRFKFSRFTPRPFTRTSASGDVAEIESETEAVITQRIPARLPFGRTRAPVLTSSTIGPGILARRIPFSRQTTTQQSLLTESDDLPSEEKLDDISLSESIVEEKEHAEDNDEAEDQPKRRIVIKKLLTPSSTTEGAPEPSSENSTDENGRRKIKIIRRRPSSTTESVEISSQSTESASSNQNRIRKVIRKKLRPLEEDEPEIIAKSIGSLNGASKQTTTEIVFNYGEKTRPTIVSSTLAPTHTEIPEEENYNNKQQDITEELQKTEEKKQEQVENLAFNYENTKEKENSKTVQDEKLLIEPKPEVVIETEQQSVDLSENKEEGTSAEESDLEEDEKDENFEKSQPQTSTTSTTQLTSPTRGRVPYRPPKRLFTSTTESTPSSSRTFSRKFNSGVYTSPSTITKASEEPIKTATRRPLFSSRTFTRRPFTTARTTKTVEEEEEEYSDEGIAEEEENPLVLVPPNQLFSRRPRPSGDVEENPESEEDLDVVDDVLELEEPRNKFIPSSRQPFRPKVVNSNTFRSSTSTTELPKRTLTSLNRTSIYSRLGGNKPVGDTKKRVQNVPVGYSSPVNDTLNITKDTDVNNFTQQSSSSSTNPTELLTEDDDYLTMTEAGTTSTDTTNTSSDITNSIESETATDEMEIDDSTDDYLEYTENTTNYPSTQDSTTNTQSLSENEESGESFTVTRTEPSTEVTSTYAIVETTTAQASPIVKTQFNKLFSVSRSVEVSSKLDKHRLNKNNQTTLVEEGKVMVETKPRVDKIGEVSRFSLIKIFEDEIPIYLTKLGHVYPVENPPDNLIRIDEARNARALVENFSDVPRENLIASESMNEAYRHINKVVSQHKHDIMTKTHVEHVPNDDDFLSYINFDRKSDKLEEDQSYQPQWQFVPAAYENERNRAAKSFEIITPRSMLTEPSTLPLEGLFKTETPVMARKISDKINQPFVVYSAAVPTQNDDANIVKLQVSKPESGRSIITFAKGQEFSGGSVTDEATVKYPVNISVIPLSSETTVRTTVQSAESTKSSPIVEMLTTSTTTANTEPTTTSLTITETATTETITEEITTVKTLFDTKRKFAFPRRPIIKSSNITRATTAPRLATKKNATISTSTIQKVNKTTGFNPTKSRFTGNRGQNVPIDIRKKVTPKLAGKTSTTSTSRPVTTDVPRTTTERKLHFKPIRPIRPAFVPRRSSTPSSQGTGET